MQHQIILQSAFLFLLTICLALAIQDSTNERPMDSEQGTQDKIGLMFRSKRATSKPGFFRTFFSTIFEQWNDTKNTFGTVNKLINDNFLPDNAPLTEAVTAVEDPNATTTEPPYKITRKEFARILRRNLVGIQKLYDLELKDALKESDKYSREFRKNASIEISKYL